MTQNVILSEIILCVQGGIYVFQLMDHYTAVVSLMFLAFFEVLAITLIFGEFHFLQSALQDHRKPYAAIEAPLQLRYEGFISPLSCSLAGVSRLSLMVEKMLGKKPNLFFRVCWQFLSPMLVLVRKRKPEIWDPLYLLTLTDLFSGKNSLKAQMFLNNHFSTTRHVYPFFQ